MVVKVLRLIKQHKKIRPAGMTLLVNDSLPISESSWCFVLLGFLGSCEGCKKIIQIMKKIFDMVISL